MPGVRNHICKVRRAQAALSYLYYCKHALYILVQTVDKAKLFLFLKNTSYIFLVAVGKFELLKKSNFHHFLCFVFLEKVYIYGCMDATIDIKGKCKMVAIDSCKKTQVTCAGHTVR